MLLILKGWEWGRHVSEMGKRRHKREQCKHRNVGVACPAADITAAHSDWGEVEADHCQVLSLVLSIKTTAPEAIIANVSLAEVPPAYRQQAG